MAARRKKGLFRRDPRRGFIKRKTGSVALLEKMLRPKGTTGLEKKSSPYERRSLRFSQRIFRMRKRWVRILSLQGGRSTRWKKSAGGAAPRRARKWNVFLRREVLSRWRVQRVQKREGFQKRRKNSSANRLFATIPPKWIRKETVLQSSTDIHPQWEYNQENKTYKGKVQDHPPRKIFVTSENYQEKRENGKFAFML